MEQQPEPVQAPAPVSPGSTGHSPPRDFFISAARQDQPWAEWIGAQLEATGSTTFMEAWDIRPGENLVLSLDQALATTARALLLLSPAALRDGMLQAQWAAVLRNDPIGAHRRLIPVVVEACVLPPLLASLVSLDLQGLDEPQARSRLLDGLQTERLPRPSVATTPFPGTDSGLPSPAVPYPGIRSGSQRTRRSGTQGPGGSASSNWINLGFKLQRLYEEALDDSLQKLAWVELHLTSLLGAVQTPANLLLRRVQVPPQPLPPGTTIQEVYQQAGQELLILGESGAGKSTLLYRLGQELLKRAQSDAALPLPVVFPLASWAKRRFSLQEWMVTQLSSPLYDNNPRQLSHQWIQQQRILPLLDGLDEVAEDARPACIAAINAFHSAYPLCPLVVCSRSQEYQTASESEHLQLSSAVEVQPLTLEQQENVLLQAGSIVESLQAELATNAGLRDLIQTPIWLSLLLVIARNGPLSAFPQEPPALQQEVLRRYVQRMCERKGDTTQYPLEKTIHWLGFLASHMRQHNQAVFALEELQPDWLPKRFRLSYGWSVGLTVGPLSGLLVGIAFGLTCGPIYGVIMGLLMGGMLGCFIGMQDKITFAERFRWSWRGSLNWLRFGAIIAIISIPLLALFSIALFGPLLGGDVAVAGALSMGLCVGPTVGLQPEPIIERHLFRPGEGIRRSTKNGLVVGLVVGFLTILIATALAEGIAVRIVASTLETENERFFSLVAVFVSELLVGVMAGIIVGLLSGLFATLKYRWLCFLLASGDIFPQPPMTFLNNSCDRAFLKRVGGTYRFIHRLLLEYFADQK